MFLKTKNLIFTQRRFINALYVSKENAFGNVRSLRPTLDFEDRLKNRTELENNIKRRGLETLVNTQDLCDRWEKYKDAASHKKLIELRKLELIKLINQAKTEGANQQTLDGYFKESRDLKIELKNKCDDSFNDELCNDFLELPNKLSSNAPDEPEIVFTFGSNSSECSGFHHLTYDNLIEYVNETSYYLRNEAAKFHRIFPSNLLEYLSQQKFMPICNPDFAKTSIIEAGGVSLNHVFGVDKIYNEKCTNLDHLVGSGSWLSFLSLLAKTKLDESLFPIKYATTGQIYRPTMKNDRGLFDVTQSTAIQLFLAGTDTQMEQKWNETLELFSKIFKAMNVHFRIVNVPARKLELFECFATTFEMYSPHSQEYIEVGRFSQYGDFISKRLQFMNHKHYRPHLLGGICNITKILAIILETNDGNIPSRILSQIQIE